MVENESVHHVKKIKRRVNTFKHNTYKKNSIVISLEKALTLLSYPCVDLQPTQWSPAVCSLVIH